MLPRRCACRQGDDHRRDPAIEQARAAKELYEAPAERQSEYLIELAQNDDTDARLREWAVRRMADYRDGLTAEFLKRVISEADDRERYPGAMPFVAKEALKRRDLLPERYNRFIMVP